MPNCRRPLAFPAPLPERPQMRLSRYMVKRRVPPRAMNDNRRPWSFHGWQWGVAIGIAPTITALLLLSGLF